MATGKDIQDHVDLFRNGNEKGLSFFYKALRPGLVYFAFRILNDKPEAEDIVEESFGKIWERRSTFYEDKVIKSWLYTTVRNASINKLQQEQRLNVRKEQYALEQEGSYQSSPLYDIEFAEFIVKVHATISVLPVECQKIFRLMYIKGKTVREIAEELQLSISTVKNQKTRGLDILRKRFPQLATGAIFDMLDVSTTIPVLFINAVLLLLT